MVPIEQVANGLMIFARDNLIGQIPKDNYKYIAGNVALELLGYKINQHKQEFTTKVIEFLNKSPFGQLIEVVTQDGMVDIEILKTLIPKYVQPDGFKVHIPMIGVFSILPNDIDVMYNCIINVPATSTLPGGVN